MVEILLNQLNAEIIANQIYIEGKTVVLNNIDACGVIDMSVDLFRTLFLYQLDSYLDWDKIKYYSVYNPDFVYNPANAKLDRPQSFGAITTIDPTTMDVKNDFLKYLALKLFNTHYGVILFKNKPEMLTYLSTIIETEMNNVYSSLMYYINFIDGTSENVTINPILQKVYDYRIERYVYTYIKYTTDSYNTNNNLCRELLLQLFELAPTRFTDIANTITPQPLPFMVGDIISFKIGIHAANGQELLTNASPIPMRTYEIKIILNNSTYKTLPLPQTKAIVNYVQTNSFPRLNFTNYADLEMYDFTLFNFCAYIQSAETNVVNGTNSYVTGMIQIYPKAFNGITTFPFNNIINGNDNGNTNYETNSMNNRMFYIHNMTNVNLAADALSITVNATTGDFIFEINITKIVHLQVELENNGKLPIQYIASKNFDINFI